MLAEPSQRVGYFRLPSEDVPRPQRDFDFSAPPDPTTRNMVVLVAEANKSKFMPGFPLWLEENYPIWACFRAKADALRAMGRKHHGARNLIEVIRYETALQEVDGDFKINNNAAPDLSRLYLLLHPDAAGFFELRGRR